MRYIEEHKDQAKQRPKSVEVKPQQDDREVIENFILSGPAALADLDKQTPILLNVFVSMYKSIHVKLSNIIMMIFLLSYFRNLAILKIIMGGF